MSWRETAKGKTRRRPDDVDASWRGACRVASFGRAPFSSSWVGLARSRSSLRRRRDPSPAATTTPKPRGDHARAEARARSPGLSAGDYGSAVATLRPSCIRRRCLPSRIRVILAHKNVVGD